MLFNSFKFISIVIVCLGMAKMPVFAQETQQQWEDQEGDIEDAEVVIEKSLNIELPRANRKFEKIPPLPLQEGEPAAPFAYRNLKAPLKKLDPEIRVLKVAKDSLPKFYGSYVKAGFGNYASPLFEGYFNNRRNKQYAYGIDVIHHSSGKGPVDGSNSGTSFNQLGFNTKFFTGNHTIGVKGDYQRQKHYFYGYTPGLEVDRDTIKQVFNIFNLEAKIGNNPEDPENFNYDLKATFDKLNDNFNASENQFGLHLNSRVGLGDQAQLSLNGDLHLTEREDIYNDTINVLERNFFRITPSLSFVMDDAGLTAKGGFNVVYEDDTVDNAGFLHFYPFIAVDYQITDGLLLKGKVDGNVQRTSLLNFIRENPYLGPDVPLYHTNKTFGLEGSFLAQLMSNLVLEGGIKFGSYRNMYFFNNSATDSTRFDIMYDKGETTLFTFFGELSYNFTDKFRAIAQARYNEYNTDNLEEPWHKPLYELNLISKYNIYDKIMLNANFELLGGIKAKNLMSNNETTLNNIADLGIEIEYLFSKQFSAFLNFDNVFGQNYERYLNYPSKGLMIQGGVTYSF